MNTLSRRILKDAAGTVLSQQEFGYNGNLPGSGSPTLNKPDLSRAVNGTLTINTKYVYDTYGDAAHKQVVTALSTGETDSYDANGKMITRVESGLTYTQTFDAENRLISVMVSGQTTQFVYDGNGNLVKKVKPDGSRTIYPSISLRAGVGGLYEVDKNSGGTVRKPPCITRCRSHASQWYSLLCAQRSPWSSQCCDR